ncbi:MAG: tetratricopeptide repeat protein [Armatimonadota bacterium]
MSPCVRPSRLLSACAVLLLCAAGFAQDDQPAAAPATSRLILSPAAFGGTFCYQGWPLVLELTLWREPPPGDTDTPAEALNLTAKQGTWCEALVVTIKNEEGATVQWPWHLVSQDGAQFTLATGDSARVEWWLTPEETQALPEGSYTLSVAFDPQRVEDLPTGAAAPQADPCHLTLKKSPATLEADLASTKLYRQAWYSLVRKDKAGAEAAISQLLALDPKSIGARRLQALLAAREGRVEEGLKLIDEALALYATKHPHACPPFGLHSLREQLERQLPEE